MNFLLIAFFFLLGVLCGGIAVVMALVKEVKAMEDTTKEALAEHRKLLRKYRQLREWMTDMMDAMPSLRTDEMERHFLKAMDIIREVETNES